MGKTTIEWCDFTFNPWWGCTKVSAGCTNCYADTLATRYGHKIWGPKADRRFFGDKHWAEPLKWQRDAAAAGQRRRVFCASMADVFERHMVHDIDAEMAFARARLWKLIEATPALDWLLLTKRPEHIRVMVPPGWLAEPRPNVWFGTSTENQEEANKRVPELLKVPAVVRFLSAEPLLGPIDLTFLLRQREEKCWRCDWVLNGEAGRCVCGVYHEPLIHWLIAGGESGPGARGCHPEWLRSLRDQCTASGVAFHFKQWGEYVPVHGGKRVPLTWNGVRIPDDADATMMRVGKKAAGRLLDGREWNEFPEVPA